MRVGEIKAKAIFSMKTYRKAIFVKISDDGKHSTCKRYVLSPEKGIIFNNYGTETRLNNDHFVSHIFKK